MENKIKEARHRCEWCGDLFVDEKDLIDHKKRGVVIKMKCKICGSELIFNKWASEYFCMECGNVEKKNL